MHTTPTLKIARKSLGNFRIPKNTRNSKFLDLGNSRIPKNIRNSRFLDLRNSRIPIKLRTLTKG